MPNSQYVYPVKSLLSGVQSDHDAPPPPDPPLKPKKKKTKSSDLNKTSPNFRHFPAESRGSASFSRFPAERESGFDEDLTWNPSLLGLVHLPPLPEGVTPDGIHLMSGGSSHNESTGSTTASEDSEYVTERFQHIEDEHGHHVITGRAGKIQKCEDEPIRTPGAVQGFGVLIAVDENDDVLLVRQVSENSTRILGLSPEYLFSLTCFTDALPESQATLLWDNIEFLSEPNDDEEGPHVFLLTGYAVPPDPTNPKEQRRTWTCWCAVHRSPGPTNAGGSLIVMEFEPERDLMYPLYPPSDLSPNSSPQPQSHSGLTGLTASGTPESVNSVETLVGDGGGEGPSIEDILESTTTQSKPLPALERLRRKTNRRPVRGGGGGGDTPGSSSRRPRGQHASSPGTVGMMDVFAVMSEIDDQLGAAQDLDTFLKVVAGVIKDLSMFHRVLVYKFDEAWNGLVEAELVDWKGGIGLEEKEQQVEGGSVKDLFKGLHFPAADIPKQARELYTTNKVRLLYDRDQPTARIVVRAAEDLDVPLDMTHAYLRAMSPIHLKYLGNMGVRASMSVSIMAFGALWGLVACHSYGPHGMRVSFPVRQMLRLLSQSISKNIERLSYAQRLHTRKLLKTITTDQHATAGYIVSNADDLLGMFDADYGILVVGEGAKLMGPNEHGQEVLIMAEYLRLKQYTAIQISQAVTTDFPDLPLSTGPESIAGLLLVPLSSSGKDFIALLRKGQQRHVHWAGKPSKEGKWLGQGGLEPRKSFQIWSETVAGRSRGWTDEQLETAGTLALVYGKFIEVWRDKETALQTTKLTNLLLSNARHEVRTPLNHIINCLEMALNGPLDQKTRINLSESHTASKGLLFTINDLLDLTRMETGDDVSTNEPFNLPLAIEEATYSYRNEADRRSIKFVLDVHSGPKMVVGDAKKIRAVVQNLTTNALKYTQTGTITVRCTTFGEPEGLRGPSQTAVEIVVADTGCGISPTKLENIYKEFEQAESSELKTGGDTGVGLGLAVVSRIVQQLGGRLRVKSNVGDGSQFSFLIPLTKSADGHRALQSKGSTGSLRLRTETDGRGAEDGIDSLCEVLSSLPRPTSVKSKESRHT